MNDLYTNIIFPYTLLDTFRELVKDNEYEKMAILYGRKINGEDIFVDYMIFPKQKGTRFNVELSEEIKLLDSNYIYLGWIHSHVQSLCRLSNTDIKTQKEMQAIFPNSLSIVYSIKYNMFGIFSIKENKAIPQSIKFSDYNFDTIIACEDWE